MTLPGHTSTLPRLVVQGHDFEGHSLGCRFGPTSSIMVGLLTRVMIYDRTASHTRVCAWDCALLRAPAGGRATPAALTNERVGLVARRAQSKGQRGH